MHNNNKMIDSVNKVLISACTVCVYDGVVTLVRAIMAMH